jgi:hypothetical protein
MPGPGAAILAGSGARERVNRRGGRPRGIWCHVSAVSNPNWPPVYNISRLAIDTPKSVFTLWGWMRRGACTTSQTANLRRRELLAFSQVADTQGGARCLRRFTSLARRLLKQPLLGRQPWLIDRSDAVTSTGATRGPAPRLDGRPQIRALFVDRGGQETHAPEVWASPIVCQHGLRRTRVFKWRQLYVEGAFVHGGEVVAVSEYRALQHQVRDLQRLLGL